MIAPPSHERKRMDARTLDLDERTIARDEIACGIDLVEIDRFAAAVSSRGSPFLTRIFTLAERQECRGSTARLAARFAAKEAVLKALGTGLNGIALYDIEVLTDPGGRPRVRLAGTALDKAVALNLSSWTVSLSHSKTVAAAVVLASGRDLLGAGSAKAQCAAAMASIGADR